MLFKGIDIKEPYQSLFLLVCFCFCFSFLGLYMGIQSHVGMPNNPLRFWQQKKKVTIVKYTKSFPLPVPMIQTPGEALY